MLSYVISGLGVRVDSKFLTAYWLPAFVAMLGVIGILGARVGPQFVTMWIDDLDSVVQSLSVLIVVVLITMLAIVLRALTRPITEVFAGIALPGAVATWSTRGQRRAKTATAHMLGATPNRTAAVAATQAGAAWLDSIYPL